MRGRRWPVRSTAVLCGMLKGNFPAGKDEYGRMTLESPGKGLCAFHPQINSAVLYSRDGRLWNTCKFGKLTLAQFLEFAQDTHGFSN